MARICVFPLEPSYGGVTYREGYIADVRKYGIGDSDPASFEISDSPVIFLKHGRLVEKLWNAPAATSTAQPRSWASSQAVALQGAPHDMDSTPSTPEDARFILGEIRDVDSQGKAGHHYLEMHMETRVNGQWSTIIYHLPGEPLIYRFIIDTAGGVNSWVYGICAMEYMNDSLRVDGLAPMEEAGEKEKLYGSKCKYPMPDESIPGDQTTLQYGTGRIAVQQSTARISVRRNHPSEPLALGEFALGAAYKCDPPVLRGASDGIFGLGPSLSARADSFTSPPSVGRSKTLTEVLRDRGEMQEREFYIYITHDHFDHRRVETHKPSVYLISPRRDDCICFGGWPDDEHFEDPDDVWKTIHVAKDASGRTPLWNLELKKITVSNYGDDAGAQTVEVGERVRLDIGAHMSYLPIGPCADLHQKLKTHFGAPSLGASPRAVIWVHFEFVDGRDNSLVTVSGQGKRFFTTDRDLDGTLQCGVQKTDKTSVLGLNFFRTFIVGFVDEVQPYIKLRRQKQV